MTLTPARKFWLLVASVLIGFFWIFHSVLTPFLLGLVIAYLLNPSVDKLQNMGLNRLLSTNIAMFGFLGAIGLFGLLFVPIIIHQITDLIVQTPIYTQRLVDYANTHFSGRWNDISPDIKEYAQKYFGTALGSAAGITKNIFSSLLSGSISIVQSITSIVIILVVAFYLLLDWHILIQKVDSWLPRHHRDTIRDLIGQMDSLQSAFIRGQVIVCLFMMIYYVMAFKIMGINYGFVLGMITGILTFIPYVGASIGFVMTISVTAAQYLPEYSPLLIMMAIFGVGQTLEGYVLVPKLVGGSVGMHPVWIMFALMAFGSVFGITGMLIAVPVTAAIGVLTKFMLENYMLSCYYNNDTRY